MKYFGAIDQGTTSSRFIVFDDKGKIIIQNKKVLGQEQFINYKKLTISIKFLKMVYL